MTLTHQRRFATAALAAIASAAIAQPVSCGALLLVQQHVWGDVDSGGPASILGSMAIAAIVAVLTFVGVLALTRPSEQA